MTKNIGVIGLGSIGMRHAKNLIAMGHGVLGQDIDSNKVDDLLKNGGRGSIQPNEIGRGSIIDAIIIATPTDLHCSGIMDTPLEVPIFVEKPIGCVNDFGILIERLKLQNAPFVVGNNLRFHSCVKQAKEWLEADRIGTPIWASFTVAQLNTKYTDDVVTNWGAHELDLARYLLGDAVVVKAWGDESIVDIILCQTTDGSLMEECQTTVHLDYLTPNEIRGFTIAGEKGRIHCDLVKRIAILGPGDEVHNFTDSFDGNYIEEMQAFLDVVDGTPSRRLATGQDGLATLGLIWKAKKLAGIV